MDPNTALTNLLALANQAADVNEHTDLATDLAEAFLDLHEWLATGGFKPAAWERGAYDWTANEPSPAELRAQKAEDEALVEVENSATQVAGSEGMKTTTNLFKNGEREISMRFVARKRAVTQEEWLLKRQQLISTVEKLIGQGLRSDKLGSYIEDILDDIADLVSCIPPTETYDPDDNIFGSDY